MERKDVLDPKRIIYLHGLDSNSQTHKAGIIRAFFPDMIVPDFTGSLEERMTQLYPILGGASNWTLIGSSFGGLMAALFSAQHPNQVRRLLLLAPALMLPEFAQNPPKPITVPTVIIHGRQDTIVPLGQITPLAGKAFRYLTYHIVDDDHRLHQTAETLDWKSFIQ
jgi:pimeloyl-ACP methyl ester carboxylesterase